MNREEAKQRFDSFGKGFTLDEARTDVHILIDKIYDDFEKGIVEEFEGYGSDSSICFEDRNFTKYEVSTTEYTYSKKYKIIIKEIENE